jgi:hypothetical protein
MNDIIKTLSKKFTGYGHYKLSVIIDGVEYSKTTTNIRAIDAAFDDMYDDDDNSDRIYTSQKHAQETLIREILDANKKEILF